MAAPLKRFAVFEPKVRAPAGGAGVVGEFAFTHIDGLVCAIPVAGPPLSIRRDRDFARSSAQSGSKPGRATVARFTDMNSRDSEVGKIKLVGTSPVGLGERKNIFVSA